MQKQRRKQKQNINKPESKKMVHTKKIIIDLMKDNTDLQHFVVQLRFILYTYFLHRNRIRAQNWSIKVGY